MRLTVNIILEAAVVAIFILAVAALIICLGETTYQASANCFWIAAAYGDRGGALAPHIQNRHIVLNDSLTMREYCTQSFVYHSEFRSRRRGEKAVRHARIAYRGR